MHKTGIIPKATPLGSGSHHGLFVLRFIPHPWSHGCEGITGSLCSQVSCCSAGFSTKQWQAPKRWEARGFLPSLPLVPPQQWLLCPLKVSILCGFWFHQAFLGPELRHYHLLLLSLQSQCVGSAVTDFWVTFPIFLLSFFWHLWKRFLQ